MNDDPGRIRVHPEKIREISLPGMGLRFAFGMVVSVIAGLVGQRWGVTAGGVFLAFPAVMAATLTLIQDEEHSRVPVAQDARGAVLGAIGMIVFAVCVWALAGRVPAVPALALATVAWMIVSAVLYLAVRRHTR
ncbi:DUF3147 family protein [Sphaerisporangium sp. NPDC005289]|uniref:DUF3147 family protein n=1 Tax=Sphaerisporangium rhizosphaerae TaxID=2269375 RepID=A0ABW2P5F9_9ACTN